MKTYNTRAMNEAAAKVCGSTRQDYCASRDTCQELLDAVEKAGKQNAFLIHLLESWRPLMESSEWHFVTAEPVDVVKSCLMAMGKWQSEWESEARGEE